MKKKTIAVTVIISVFLIGIVSASLIDYFGKISGMATVEGPVFYATKNKGTSGSLSINEFPEGSGKTYIINKNNVKIFKTEEFDEPMDFYNPILNLSVEANLTKGTPNKSINLEFGYFDKANNGRLFKICDVVLDITKNEYNVYSDTCEGNKSIEGLKGFYYMIRGMNTGGVQIKVNTRNQETKAQVLGVAD